ncbi:hypothetical protein LSH36_979g02003 [Paralvinella palmiformis]|uniref:Uncharacterized protein n=1 Tax=Paralvinella palmiformis TaxID=53620 RepID=A0AAD9MQJ3_9ANNE|nr:hypothetical protein LSH36_979g02003 [Paralvinella palmiformis]
MWKYPDSVMPCSFYDQHIGHFFIFLFIIFALLLAVGIWAVVEKDSLKTQVRKMLKDAVEHYDEPEKKKFMDNIQTKGCADRVFDFISKHVIIIAGITIGIGVVMLLGMIFSMCLCCEIRRGAEDKY